VPGYARFAVLDIDPWKEGEADRIEEVVRTYGDLPATFTVLTGKHGEKRGRHYWYQAPADIALPRKVAGLDLRSGESHVLLPPSRHHSGVEYEVESGDLAKIVQAPEWILSAGSEGQRPGAQSKTAVRTGIGLGKRSKVALS